MKRTQYQDEKLLGEIVGTVGDATQRGLAAIANPDSLAEAATWWRGWGSFAYLSAEYVTDAANDWQAIAPRRYRELLEAMEIATVKAVQAPGYTYDRNAGRYRNATTGRYVSFEQVYRLLDSLGTGRLEVMERLTHEMHNGAISPAAWLLSMQHELVRAHLQASALGAGGWQQLTAQDYQRVDRSLRQELVRMEAFGRDIRAGRVFSEAQLRNRLGMYLGTARTHYFHAMRPPTPGPDEETLERRMLGDADHCSLCVYLAMLGWQPAGTLPVPGESVAWWEEDQCLSNCQCEMFRATMSKDEAERVRGEEPERAFKAGELELIPAMVGKAWVESQHPRHAAGDERGGEFAPKEGGSYGSGKTGKRKDWNKHKFYLRALMANPSVKDLWGIASKEEIEKIDQLEHGSKDRWKAMLGAIANGVENLTQEEMSDILFDMATTPEVNIFARLTPEVIDEHLQMWDDGALSDYNSYIPQPAGLIVSRLDEDVAFSLLERVTKARSEIEKIYPAGTSDWDKKQLSLVNTLIEQIGSVGPSHNVRMTAKMIRDPKSKRNQPLATVEEAVDRMIYEWTATGDSIPNAWVHAAAAKAFGGVDAVTGYWNLSSYGVVLRDPDPMMVEGAKEIYRRTQAFYADPKRAKKMNGAKVYRGVNSQVTKRSIAESWSLSAAVAKKFDGHDVMEETVDVKRIFMSWESMAGIFPPESELKGKKEVTLFGLDWMVPK